MNSFRNMNDMWWDAVNCCVLNGKPQESRDGPTMEYLGWSGRLTNADASTLVSPTRKMDPAYACGELLWYLSGKSSVEAMCAYAPGYKRFANPQEPTGRAWGAYGERLRNNPGFVYSQDTMAIKEGRGFDNQLEAAVELLNKRPDTRQCVVTMWDSKDITEAIIGEMNDMPCTIALQFLRRNNALHAHGFMRSNDIWLGMPYDVFCFTGIQQLVAHRLGIVVGSYCHSVGSMHAYVRDLPKIKNEPVALNSSVCDNKWNPHTDASAGEDKSWDGAAALDREKNARMKPEYVPTEDLGIAPTGNLVADCAAVCQSKLLGVSLPIGVSPALRRAWEIKYGTN